MEKNNALDLLDALARNGSLDLYYAELHVIVLASSHSFERNTNNIGVVVGVAMKFREQGRGILAEAKEFVHLSLFFSW